MAKNDANSGWSAAATGSSNTQDVTVEVVEVTDPVVVKDKRSKGPRESKAVCGELFIGENAQRNAVQLVCAAPAGHPDNEHHA